MIAGRQVVDEEGQLVWGRLDAVAFRPNQLEDVWVFLVRHDAASRSHLRWEGNEPKILVDVQGTVHGELAEGRGNGGQGGRHDLFCLPPAHLRIDGVVVEGSKMEDSCGHLPV